MSIILGRALALDPTSAQASHLRRACGMARYACNWGLAEWQRMRASGEKPSADKIKRCWNAYRKTELPWSCDVTECAGVRQYSTSAASSRPSSGTARSRANSGVALPEPQRAHLCTFRKQKYG
jgi:hypothetical protein